MMSRKMLAMPIQKEISRLRGLGFSDRAIARSLKIHRLTVKKYLEKFQTQEKELFESTEMALLNKPEMRATIAIDPAIQGPCEAAAWTLLVDWNDIHKQSVDGVPLLVLWEELKESKKISVQYPGFWKQFHKRFPNLPLTMRRVFAPGDRTEIDYCDGIEILNASTGEILSTELFVGVLCHSRYVFAEFSFSQKSEDFLASHARMFQWFGGVTPIVSPDNLKSAVTKVHYYDPVINPAYSRLAAHYGFTVVPARVRTPKDKAIVERSIQIFQRWFYFKVRNKTFTSLTELNQCLQEYLIIFNAKKHRIFRRSRQEMFEEEKKILKSLPPSPYEVATHKRTRLYDDCHLVFEHCYYSAPYQLRSQELDVWITAKTLQIHHNGERVALHNRSHHPGLYITKNEHYPPAQQAYAETTPAYVRKLSSQIGPHTEQLIESILNGPCPLRYLRTAQGIVRLAKVYGRDRLEKAASKANTFNQKSYRYIVRILKNGPLEKECNKGPIQRNPNPFLRGKELLH
jgi:hypothetical protein